MSIRRNAQNVQTSLSIWASELSSPTYDPNWNTEVSQNGVDPSKRRVNIQLNWLAVCEKLAYKLFNGRNILLKDGIMTKGALTIKLGSEENLQGWNGPLTLFLESPYKQPKSYVGVEGFNQYDSKGVKIMFKLKHGMMSGLVTMYGKMPNEPSRTCLIECHEQGLGYFGHFENGKPVGAAWRGLIGNGWIYGKVDQQGDHSGNEIAYIFNDFQTALLGHFEKGIMVRKQNNALISSLSTYIIVKTSQMEAKEAKVQKEKCDANGIKEINFSKPFGQSYHYSPQNATSLGDQPTISKY